MAHVRPENVFVVSRHCYSIRSGTQTRYEVIAVRAIGKACENAADCVAAVVCSALLEDEEVGLGHFEKLELLVRELSAVSAAKL